MATWPTLLLNVTVMLQGVKTLFLVPLN
jgi:hypothetical protein